MIEIAPSIIAADYLRLGDALDQLESGGADMVHVDVMDGHYVPNLTIGPDVVKSLARGTRLGLDCHLMIEEPERWVDAYIDAGAARLSVHAEACRHLQRTAASIRSRGIAAGVALNPATPLESLDEVLGDIDGVLIMSVNPGFSGQTFLPSSIDKVRRLALRIRERGLAVEIQVDGGVSEQNAAELVRSGARRLVAGSAVFGKGEPAKAIARLRAEAEAGL